MASFLGFELDDQRFFFELVSVATVRLQDSILVAREESLVTQNLAAGI